MFHWSTGRHKWLAGFLISLLITLSVLISYILGVMDRIELNAYDIRFRIRGQRVMSPRIRVIAIDDKSLQAIGKWPWRREIHAKLIKILSEYGAETVMFDILFMEPDRQYPEDDTLLINATKKAGNIYYPFYFPIGGEEISLKNPGLERFGRPVPDGEEFLAADSVIHPYGALMSYSRGSGFVNSLPDEDGVTRRGILFIQHIDRIYPMISFRMACDTLGIDLDEADIKPGRKTVLVSSDGKNLELPLDGFSQLLIDFPGSEEVLRGYSYSDILDEYDQGPAKDTFLEDLRDKFIFIGLTAAGTVDINAIPFSSAYPMVGVHASIFNNMLSGNFIRASSKTFDILLLSIIGLLMGAVIPKLRAVAKIAFTSLLLILYASANYALFIKYGLSLPIVYPLVLIFLCDLSLVIYRYATEEKEKKWIRGVFSTYITPSVVDEILKNPAALSLGGERRWMTVYFSDLAGFTTISEALSPEELVRLMNEYLEAMTEVIFKYQGTLDKYEGDAIMAFWNAPIHQPDHAVRCCKASLECLETLKTLQKKWGGENRPNLDMRIGMNSGPMIVGNMGSRIRMDYTVMGDAVNLGARLESANKEYGTRIMMSEMTKVAVEKEIEFRELDALKVKGKKKPVLVYEVMAEKGKLTEDQKKLLELYNQGLKCYKSCGWENGIRLFSEALEIINDDGPSSTYLKRCREYRENPPPAGWDGVCELHTK